METRPKNTKSANFFAHLCTGRVETIFHSTGTIINVFKSYLNWADNCVEVYILNRTRSIWRSICKLNVLLIPRKIGLILKQIPWSPATVLHMSGRLLKNGYRFVDLLPVRQGIDLGSSIAVFGDPSTTKYLSEKSRREAFLQASPKKTFRTLMLKTRRSFLTFWRERETLRAWEMGCTMCIPDSEEAESARKTTFKLKKKNPRGEKESEGCREWKGLNR